MRLCGHGPSVRLHVTLEMEKPRAGGGGGGGEQHAPKQCTLAVELLTQAGFRVLGIGFRVAGKGYKSQRVEGNIF